MKLLEQLKLLFRARKYRYRNDPGEIAYLLAKLKKGETALDIGAHKGAYLYYMRQQVGAGGKIYAFEPQSILYKYLLKIKKVFAWDNLTIEHAALSDAPGKLSLYLPLHKSKKNKTSPGASLLKHAEGTQSVVNETVEVLCLDDYCRAKNIVPAFLKVDVEGNELAVFKGGAELLLAHKPYILVEIEARHIGREKAMETFSFLEGLGYQGFFMDGTTLRPLSEFDFDKHQNLAKKEGYCNNFIFEG